MDSRTTVILPTLNEARNIAEVIGRLLNLYPGITIIVADDGSTDGTRELVASLAKARPGIRLLDRSGAGVHGLTASVLDAVAVADAEFIVVMDADMQHPPEKVAELLGALRGSDIAVGCRMKVSRWALRRKAMSMAADLLGRAVLRARGAPECADILSGFFAVRRELFAAAARRNYRRFELAGYKVLFDLLKCLPPSVRIEDVPYEFGMRRGGSSKIGTRHVLAFLRSLLR